MIKWNQNQKQNTFIQYERHTILSETNENVVCWEIVNTGFISISIYFFHVEKDFPVACLSFRFSARTVV